MGDMSGRSFAARLGKSPTTVNQYLNGRTPPSDFIVAVCETFKVGAWWLLTGDGPMKQDEKQLALSCKNREMLVQTIAALEGSMKKKGLKLEPVQIGKVAVKIFENLQCKDVSPDDVKSIEKEVKELLDLLS